MALKGKKKTVVVHLFVNRAQHGTKARGHYYSIRRKTTATPLVLKKYNKVLRKRVEYKQQKG